MVRQLAATQRGTRGYPLFDGSILVMAEVAMTDRSGTTHLEGVVPDEIIPIDWETYGTSDDATLQAAIDWLHGEATTSDGTPTACARAIPDQIFRQHMGWLVSRSSLFNPSDHRHLTSQKRAASKPSTTPLSGCPFTDARRSGSCKTPRGMARLTRWPVA